MSNALAVASKNGQRARFVDAVLSNPVNRAVLDRGATLAWRTGG